MTTDNIPALKIESNDDDTVTLEQEWSGNVDRVTVHALHLRFMAERLGLVCEVSASEADMVRTISTLKRRLRVLLHRINHLDDWLHEHSDAGHADLSYEQTYSMATWELASEFCADLEDPPAAAKSKPSENPAKTQPVTGKVAAQLPLVD